MTTPEAIVLGMWLMILVGLNAGSIFLMTEEGEEVVYRLFVTVVTIVTVALMGYHLF